MKYVLKYKNTMKYLGYSIVDEYGVIPKITHMTIEFDTIDEIKEYVNKANLNINEFDIYSIETITRLIKIEA